MHQIESKEDCQFSGKYGTTLSLDVKLLTEEGEFEGYASTFGDVDNGSDIVMPGAFADTLVRRPAADVKMLFQHNTSCPIGKWLELREDNKGLYAKGKLLRSIEKGREIYELMKESVLDGMSIGFRSLIDEYDRELDVRRLIKVELREISVVTFPMNEHATVSLVKNGNDLPPIRELERWLARDAGLGRKVAKAVIAGEYKSLLSAERDAGTGDQADLLCAAVRAAKEQIRTC